jgi:hypothetical protein
LGPWPSVGDWLNLCFNPNLFIAWRVWTTLSAKQLLVIVRIFTDLIYTIVIFWPVTFFSPQMQRKAAFHVFSVAPHFCHLTEKWSGMQNHFLQVLMCVSLCVGEITCMCVCVHVREECVCVYLRLSKLVCE